MANYVKYLKFAPLPQGNPLFGRDNANLLDDTMRDLYVNFNYEHGVNGGHDYVWSGGGRTHFVKSNAGDVLLYDEYRFGSVGQPEVVGYNLTTSPYWTEFSIPCYGVPIHPFAWVRPSGAQLGINTIKQRWDEATGRILVRLDYDIQVLASIQYMVGGFAKPQLIKAPYLFEQFAENDPASPNWYNYMAGMARSLTSRFLLEHDGKGYHTGPLHPVVGFRQTSTTATPTWIDSFGVDSFTRIAEGSYKAQVSRPFSLTERGMPTAVVLSNHEYPGRILVSASQTEVLVNTYYYNNVLNDQPFTVLVFGEVM